MYDIHTYNYIHKYVIHTRIHARRVYEVLLYAGQAAVLLKLGSTNRKPGHSA